MENIDNFYDKVFGKDSALFIGTLWLGMIAKHMDEVRKAEDEAFEFHGDFIYKWLNKLRTLYDNIEFKTDIPRYKEYVNFNNLVFNKVQEKYVEDIKLIPKRNKFMFWFEKIKLLLEMTWKLGDEEMNRKIRFKKEHQIMLELGECQRELYREIEKKHLIMPQERESLKELARTDWIDREKKI